METMGDRGPRALYRPREELLTYNAEPQPGLISMVSIAQGELRKMDIVLNSCPS